MHASSRSPQARHCKSAQIAISADTLACPSKGTPDSHDRDRKRLSSTEPRVRRAPHRMFSILASQSAKNRLTSARMARGLKPCMRTGYITCRRDSRLGTYR